MARPFHERQQQQQQHTGSAYFSSSAMRDALVVPILDLEDSYVWLLYLDVHSSTQQ